jgi:hypothetical protein
MGINSTSNSLRRKIGTKTEFADVSGALTPSALSYNEGDFLVYDTTNHCLKLPTLETDGQYVLGVAPITVVNGKPKPVYTTDVDASVAAPAMEGPEYGDIHAVNLKAGDVAAPGVTLYLDPTTLPIGRNVSVTGTKPVGVYTGTATVTAAAGGTEIEMLVGCAWPTGTIKF